MSSKDEWIEIDEEKQRKHLKIDEQTISSNTRTTELGEEIESEVNEIPEKISEGTRFDIFDTSSRESSCIVC